MVVRGVKTVLSDEDKRDLRPRLVYAWWLLERGVREAARGGALNEMFAIVFFHAAVEAIIQNILLVHNLGTTKEIKQWTLFAMIDAIDKKGSGAPLPPPFPHRAAVIRLAETRNAILHHGTRYHRRETDEAGSTARRFLVDATRDFLFEDIESLSIVHLVEDQWLREILGHAEIARNEGDSARAVGLAKCVVKLACNRVTRAYFGPDDRLDDRLQALTRSATREGQAGGRLTEALETLGKFMKSLKGRDYWIALSMIGADLEDARQLDALPVHTDASFAGTSGKFLLYSSKDAEVSPDEVDFAIRFAAEVCIKAQEITSSRPRPRRSANFDRTWINLPPKPRPATVQPPPEHP